MNSSVGGSNRQRGFFPGFHAGRRIVRSNHAKQPQQRRFRLAQCHWTPAQNFEPGHGRRLFDSSPLRRRRHRKDTRKNSSPIQSERGGGTVIRNIASRLKAAGNFLRMISRQAGSDRKVRRRTENQIESFFPRQNRIITKIAVPDFVAIFQPVPASRFFCQPDTVRLRLDRNKFGCRQTPGRNHSDRAQTAAKIENFLGRWATRRAIPSGQDVIRRKPMPIRQLEKPEITADGIQRLARLNYRSAAECVGRNRPRFSPAFKNRIGVMVVQGLKVGIRHWKGKPKIHS